MGVYELSYAGVPFDLDAAQAVRMAQPVPPGQDPALVPPRKYQPEKSLLEEVNRLLPFLYLQDFAPQGDWPGPQLGPIAQDSPASRMPSPQVRVGDWYYPFGARRWSVFRGLMTSAKIKAVLSATGGTGPATFVMQSVPDGVSAPGDPSAYKLSSSLYALPPRPLAEHGAGFDGLYLLTLVDERYYFQGTPATLTITNTTKWTDLLTQLASTLGITINLPTVPDAYKGPDPNSPLACKQESAAVLLDAVAANLGCRVVRNLDGMYELLNAQDSQDRALANRGDVTKVVRTAGGEISSSGSISPAGDQRGFRNAVIPARVTVTFPKYVNGGDSPYFLNGRYYPPWFQPGYGNLYSVTVGVASGGPLVSGYTGISSQVIHDTARALLANESTTQPTNNSDLTALADQIVQDFYGWQGALALDEVYPGTFSWDPEGLHDILWTYSGQNRQASTRVLRGPWNQGVRELQHNSQFTPPSPLPPGPPPPPPPPAPLGGITVKDTFSGSVFTGLTATLASTDTSMAIISPACFPTQNRWKGLIDQEKILFEGTSGGLRVDVVFRGIDGTTPADHANGSTVFQVVPDTTLNVNQLTFEKGQFVFPGTSTPGGVQEAKVVPQTQNVYLISTGYTLIKNFRCYPGKVEIFDLTHTNPYVVEEDVWLIERNALFIQYPGKRYDGQLIGWSAADTPNGQVTPRPVYCINEDGTAPNFWPPSPHPTPTPPYYLTGRVWLVTNVICDPVKGLEVIRYPFPTTDGKITTPSLPSFPTATLAQPLQFDSVKALFDKIDKFPIDAPWVGIIDREAIYFDGTKGDTNVNILQRGIQGTIAVPHDQGATIYDTDVDIQN